MKISLLLFSQLTLISLLPAVESLRGVAPSEDPLVLRPEQIKVKGSGIQAHLGNPTEITFTQASGRVDFTALNGQWDFSGHVAIAVEIENTGDATLALLGELNHHGWSKGFLQLKPSERGNMLLYLTRKRGEETPWMQEHFEKMRGLPGGYIMFRDGVDPAAIEVISISDLDGVSVGQSARIHQIRGVAHYGKLTAVDEANFFPFVDGFGQYIHEDWPGKIQTASDLRANLATELADLARHPGPDNHSPYGGWADGPRLEATGHFRTAKHDGKWWLVDPEGYLFWSHGVTGVRLDSSKTRLDGREHYFAKIPEAFSDAESTRFGASNLALKFGDDWTSISRAHTIKRLQSWGMNTIANWSEKETYLQRKMPYVVAIHYDGEPEDLLAQPEILRAKLRERLQREVGITSEDPWCIGYFVDNEIKWRSDMDAELYYKIVSEEMRRAAPNKLYLGSRFHDHNNPYGAKPHLMRAAARYCDVIGMNRYRFSPGDLQMLEDVDVPVLIGEFHFGTLDRGMIHTGLRGVVNQEQRGRLYAHYVTAALKHPNIVGTHYFQYREQSITGRFDGENYQIGFVDIADSPYTEMIDAARSVGEQLYSIRFSGTSE